MFPKVFKAIHTVDVANIVGDRIGGNGSVAQTEMRPYVIWNIVTGLPYDNLSSAPGGDFTTVQIDCYHKDEAGVRDLAQKVRAALDALLICNRVVINNRDSETKLYRVGMEADFIDPR